MRYTLLGRSGLLVVDPCLGTLLFGEDRPHSTPAADASCWGHHHPAS